MFCPELKSFCLDNENDWTYFKSLRNEMQRVRPTVRAAYISQFFITCTSTKNVSYRATLDLWKQEVTPHLDETITIAFLKSKDNRF